MEIKILGIRREAVEADLIALGAVKTFDGDIHALYYDFPDSSLAARHDVFRLRREGPESVLTFKKHLSDKQAKVMEEREVRVSDFETARFIVESLGLGIWLEMKKHRTSYVLPGVRFELDRYGGRYSYVPEFLEIEAEDIETVYRYASRLGFTAEDCKPWNTLQVAEYYAGGAER